MYTCPITNDHDDETPYFQNSSMFQNKVSLKVDKAP